MFCILACMRQESENGTRSAARYEVVDKLERIEESKLGPVLSEYNGLTLELAGQRRVCRRVAISVSCR